MDNFNKFGLNLFLAGAGEILAQNRSLSQAERVAILTGVVQGLGFKKSHAQSFSERYEEYLLQDARYMQMYQAGRNAMNTYFTDNGHIGKNLQAAMGEWNKPKPREESSGLITVLFTDIAGSTAMTQRLGDAGAQQVVRAHNRIVREALSACSGREIKHTGDGIMASFAKVTDGLDAAIQIQRGCAQHTVQNPGLPLTLKIGINAGEPIAEDNDLFGTTVQMTARICDKAKGEEILVSEIVKGICAGKTYDFVNRGGFAMKGFDGDQTLFEVQWRQGGAARPAAQPAAPAQPKPAPAAARPAQAAGAARPAASNNVRPIAGSARPAAATSQPRPAPARPAASAGGQTKLR